MKRCPKCGEEKPATAEHFHTRPRNRDGLSKDCRTCINTSRREKVRENRKNNPGFDTEYKRTWRRNESPALRILRHTKHRAKKLGIPFDLTAGDIFVPDVCPVLGIPLDTSVGTKTGPKPNSPSIDKIDPNGGYLAGNVQVMSSMANTMKHNATPEQLLAFADWVYKTYGETR